MRLVVCCATQRGLRFLEKLREIAPDASVVVFSFREEPHEPAFLEDIGAFCQRAGYAFYEARALGAPRWAEFWDGASVDVLLAVSWRYMIPRAVYERARLGAYVFHDSLLPAYRGFSPTVWSMLNGEPETGVSLIRMADALDAGDIVAQRRVPIHDQDTIAEVMERVTGVYVELLGSSLPAIAAGAPPLVAQDESQATFCCRRLPSDNEIDWSLTTRAVYDLVRAVSRPYPGAYTHLDGQKLTIWQVALVDAPRRYVGRVPGRVVEIRPDGDALVLTGDGALLVRRVQMAEGPEMPAGQVLNRTSITLGRAAGHA